MQFLIREVRARQETEPLRSTFLPARQATSANRTKYYVSFRRNDFVQMKLPKYALPKVRGLLIPPACLGGRVLGQD